MKSHLEFYLEIIRRNNYNPEYVLAIIFNFIKEGKISIDLERNKKFFQDMKFLEGYSDNVKIIYEINNNLSWINRRGFAINEIYGLTMDIISSKVLPYINDLEDLFEIESIHNEDYDIFRSFVVNSDIDLRIRMKVCEDYMELVIIRELISDSIKETIDSVNMLISEIVETPLSISQIEKRQKGISNKLIPVKKQLVNYLLDEEINGEKQKLLKDRDTLKQVITIATIIVTAEFVGGHVLKDIFKGYLRKLFSSFDPSDPDGIEKAKKKAQEWVIKQSSNQKIIKFLQTRGYKKDILTKEMEIKRRSSQGITEYKKSEMIRSSTYEMVVDIAMKAGIKEIEGKSLRSDYFKSIDTYVKAKEFCELVKKSGVLSKEQFQRMTDILDMIKRTEDLLIKEVKEAEFRIVINNGFLSEATAGRGVPGCFNPRGMHREMPLLHALEVNVSFIQIFNESARQIGNAVVIFADEGAFVYSGYNFSSYDLEPLYTEILKELSKYV
ncbi:MAG: hypothetical protein KAJ14_08435, partial [Candidatus Omnitrophica bacterium]|nr:hypothetical protein [Candidatus Omnitrophota bacterium]